jgi:hypothetical protein
MSKYHPRFAKEIDYTAKRFVSIAINQDYEVWRDTAISLDMVVLRGDGLRKVAGLYQEKYGIKMVISEETCDAMEVYNDRAMEAEVEKNLASLKPGESTGMIHVKYLKDEVNGFRVVFHRLPLLLAKDRNGRPMVVNFEGSVEAREKKDYRPSYEEKFTPAYKELQRDITSCGIFSLHILKHSLRDESFMAQVFEGESNIDVKRMVLAQGSI